MSDLAQLGLPSSHGRDGAAAPAAHRQRTLSALKWTVSGELAAQLIRFAFGIALARLLSPREFGLMAMLRVLIKPVSVCGQRW